MNTKQLRQKILDLAIHGKLIPQDPSDEPASVLLERIRAEKEKLIKEGKIKRGKNISTSDDKSHYGNVPFDLPESWAWCRLGDIAEKIGSGSTPRGGKSVYQNSGVVFIRSQNVYNDGLYIEDVAYITEVIDEQMSGTKVQPNDILLNITGASIGRSTIVPVDFGRANVNQHVSIIRLRDRRLHPFVHKVLISDYIQLVIKNVQVGAAQEGLPAEKQKDMLIPIPPLAEQLRIITAIEAAFVAIEKIECNKADLQAIIAIAKSRLLSLAIRGKLVPQDPNDEPASALLERIRAEREQLIKAGKIKRGKAKKTAPASADNSYYAGLPKSWAVCRLDEVGEIVGGGTPRTSEPSYWEGTIPWITPSDLSGYTEKYITSGSRKISEKGLAESSARLIPAGSVLFTSRAPIGYCVIAKNEVCTNQGFKSVVPFVMDNSEYIFHWLRANVEAIRSRASGTTFKEISGTEMSNTIIALPPLVEQHRIVTAIETAFEQLDSIAATIA